MLYRRTRPQCSLSLTHIPPALRSLSHNAIYTGDVKVRIMSLRFYPSPPFTRECDQVTSAALRNCFFTAKKNGCIPRVSKLLLDHVKISAELSLHIAIKLRFYTHYIAYSTYMVFILNKDVCLNFYHILRNFIAERSLPNL